jgi:hypothetical protein
VSVQDEFDMLSALLKFDAMGFARHSASVDLADGTSGAGIRAVLQVAAQRLFGADAAAEEISAFANAATARPEKGWEDFAPAVAEQLIVNALHGTAPAAEYDPARGDLALQVLLIQRISAELRLSEEEQSRMLSDARTLAS